MGREFGPDESLIWLHEHRAERSLVGGKGASLSELSRLGAPVPPAFALTTRAYELFAQSLGLPESANAVSDDELPGIRGAIESASMPGELGESLATGFHRLKQERNGDFGLAVRSSATAEDSADFSFAGLHDTILDVREMDHLEAAVKRCWASLWSERAVSYRRAGGLAIDRSAIAVVVQQLVRSDVSFVIFTADPVSGDASRVVISASWGLGEAIVSGLVTPDHIVVGPDGDVLEYAIGEKHLMIVPAPDGGQGTVELRVPSGLRRMPVLSHEQASQIAESARTLSGQLGFAADLEGGICEGVTYFFQARPITTLRDGHL